VQFADPAGSIKPPVETAPAPMLRSP